MKRQNWCSSKMTFNLWYDLHIQGVQRFNNGHANVEISWLYYETLVKPF